MAPDLPVTRRSGVVLGVLLTLAACSGRGDDVPGAIGADEAQQLNDAAAMLDANSVDANAIAANDTDTP